MGDEQPGLSTNPAVRIAYTVTLTADDYRALQWLEGHGYAANMIKHATEDEEQPDGSHVLRYRESDAWNVQQDASKDEDANGERSGEYDEAFTVCAGPTLARKMWALIDSIV